MSSTAQEALLEPFDVEDDIVGGPQGEDPHGRDGKATASIASSVFNISNTILGAGTLAMSFACKSVGIVVFFLLLAAVAVVAHKAIEMLAESVEAVRGAVPPGRSVNYPVLGKLAAGRAGEEAAKWAVVLQQTGPCIIYIQLLADIYVPIAGEAFSGGALACSRTFWMILLVVVVVLPLCMLRKLDSLRYTSLAALFFISSMVLCIIYFGVQVLNDSTKRDDALEAIGGGGGCGGDTADFDDPGHTIYAARFSADFFKAIPLLTFSFLCHQNAFPVYGTLKNANPRRMGIVSAGSMTICLLVYFLAGTFGYVAFLDATQPDLLRNFATSGTAISVPMNILRFGFGLALIFSYPIIMWELREIVDVMLFGHREPTTVRTLGLNIGIIGPALLLAVLIDDVGVVFGLIGSTCSPMIVFILPSLFWLKLHPDAPSGRRALATGTLITGCLLIPVCVGVWATDL